MISKGLGQKYFKVVSDLYAPSALRIEFCKDFLIPDFVCKSSDDAVEFSQGLDQAVRHKVFCANSVCAGSCFQLQQDLSKKPVLTGIDPLDRCMHFAGKALRDLCIGEKTLLRPRVIYLVAQELEPEIRDLSSEIVGRHILDQMSLIKYDRVISRKHTIARSDICKKKMVVYDEYLRLVGLFSGPGVETSFKMGAFFPHAKVCFAAYFAPDSPWDLECEFRPHPVFCSPGPLKHLVEVEDLFLGVKQPCIDRPVKPSQTQIVFAPHEEHVSEIDPKDLFQKWKVFSHQLFLEGLGVSRNKDPFLFLFCPQDKRDQVRKALSHTGPCFDYEVPLFFDCAGHRLCHCDLFMARLVRLKMP